ncbi:tagaturonate reductase [Lactobacillus sp. CC-MHH1034]|uniref:tagaturonate reductase n=1 Tax=Agrilactobacillus fermenti TaxID=2586909 RepID=UPI001E31555C|nr:tagaturonate reductase [Agrilactobacillus fermenti]MCD2256058.1 tagaturonate reductase [Agrilactobacillus fermenti]
MIQKTLPKLSNDFRKLKRYPTRVIQFGEGNFLRAFVDWQIQQMNKQGLFNGGVAVVQPIASGRTKDLDTQNDLYTVLLEGKLEGQTVQEHEIIECINDTVRPTEDFDAYLDLAKIDTIEFIFSNTTEAGISYDPNDKLVPHQAPNSYPGKLTALLYTRFKLGKKGFQIIPCELINHNGNELKRIVLQYADAWQLGANFKQWVETENDFYATLVDRIVPGYPKDRAEALQQEWGYQDNSIVKAEPFLIFVIEGDPKIKTLLPLKQAGINVVVTDDMQPYRNRKVSLLNGPHTTMSPIARLAGIETVGEVMADKDFYKFINDEMYQEIIPTVALPEAELKAYAEGVKERFENPFVKHELSSIALNSISKFTARLLPTLKRYVAKEHKLPLRITLALAAYLKIYQGQADFAPQDTEAVLAGFDKIKAQPNYIHLALSEPDFWGEDLTKINGFEAQVTQFLADLDTKGARQIVTEINAN